MKFDKDAMIKHRFWILVGLSVPFALVAILLLVTSVSATIEDIRKSLQTAFTSVTNVKEVKTQTDIEEQKKAADLLVAYETTAWGEAFRQQELTFGWPRGLEEVYHFSDGLFANEVQVLKPVTNKEEIPKNKPNELIHGTLKESTNRYFVVEVDVEGKKPVLLTFHVTPKLLTKGAVTNAEKSPMQFSELQAGSLVAVTCQRARYFNDPLTVEEQLLFKKTYHSQIPAILRQVDPLHVAIDPDSKQPVFKGVVQLRSSTGWMFRTGDDNGEKELPLDKRSEHLLPPEGTRFLRYVTKDWNVENDVSTEAWIAQEDLWVENEIYRVIRAANDSVSIFTEVTGKQTKQGDPVHFRNPYFDVSLLLQKDGKSLDVRIANRLARRQKIDGMRLSIRFQKDAKAEAEVVGITGDLLEANGAPGNKDVMQKTLTLPANVKRDHIYGLEQVLTWDLAAVKRIDHIAIGSMATDDTSFSHRTFPMGLQPLVKAAPKDTPAAGGKDPGGPQGSTPMGGQIGAGFGTGGGGNSGKTELLANGLSPERYQEVTPQFRRVPVAIALIVDQNHVDRVQTAFNNSKLRILVTQVLLNHYPQSLKPQMPDEKASTDGKGGGFGVGGGGGISSGSGGPSGSSPPGFGPPGFGPPGGKGSGFPGQPGGQSGGAPAASVDDLEANMELVIYGVVTIYERYPPRASVAAAAPTPPAKAP